MCNGLVEILTFFLKFWEVDELTEANVRWLQEVWISQMCGRGGGGGGLRAIDGTHILLKNDHKFKTVLLMIYAH